jgi:isoamylase
VQFGSHLAALRHKYPILRRNLFLNGQYIEDLGVRDVTWINLGGSQMSEEDWHNPALRCFGMLLDGRAQVSGIRQRGKEATLLIVFNGDHSPAEFKLPDCIGACSWSLLIDTNVTAPEASFSFGASYLVTERSLLVFVAEANPDPGVSQSA